MSTKTKESRIYFCARNPNPLFENWLQQWLKEAERKDSMKQYALAKALESLKKYPLVLYSGRDCAILDGFGTGICAMLDQQLKFYRESNPNHLCDEQEIESKEKSLLCDVKSILKEKQKDEFEKSLKLPVNLDDTLEALFRKYDKFDYDFGVIEATEQKSPKKSNDLDYGACFMPPKIRIGSGSFKILLLVDTQETAGKSKRSLDGTIKALNDKKIDYEVRRLSVGDFMWICRDQSNKSNELVLPYIVERKRMDDLASSIKDGRFHEQKFRLTECGLANKIYLIENHGNNSHVGLPLQSLLQAATNTQIQSKFSIKFTDSVNDSIFYLSVVTTLLIKMYKNKNLCISTRDELDKLPSNYYDAFDTLSEVQLMDFKEFTESTTKMKKFTIRDLFMRQLIQLKGLSIDKAVAITNIYSTPRSLILAYKNCNDKSEAANLLANIQFGKFKKTLGPVISQALYNLYCL